MNTNPHNLAESLPRRVEAIITAKGDQLCVDARSVGMGSYEGGGQVSTYFWA